MKFKIKVISKKPSSTYSKSYFGRIYFNEKEYETFSMSSHNWDVEQYQQQWQEGIERIKTHDRSCLVTSFSTDGKTDADIWMFQLYKINKKIYIQQRLLTNEFVKNDKLPPLIEFASKNCYLYVGERSKNVSEWEISLDNL